MITVNSKGTARKIPTQRTGTTTYRAGGFKISGKGRRWAKIIAGVLLFLIAVGIGHSQGLKDGRGTITATVQAQLDWCNAHNSGQCQAVYAGGGWTVMAPDDKTVNDFNNGFATSKQDDCHQGDQRACAWLKMNKR